MRIQSVLLGLCFFIMALLNACGGGGSPAAPAVSLAAMNIAPSQGLITTEAGGSASFNVVLTLQPSADVTIILSSDNPQEGLVKVSPLVFTPSNWDTLQKVTVTGQDDALADGAVAYKVSAVATSSDARYNALGVSFISLSNTDNDTAGVVFTPSSGLFTTESGGTADINLVLQSEPTSAVVLTWGSDNLDEGRVTSAASTRFTPANWNVPQTLTLTGVDDNLIDGDTDYRVAMTQVATGDNAYANLSAASVVLTNADNDSAGITVSPHSGLIVNESGGTASFDVVLSSAPNAELIMALSSRDLGEGVLDKSSLTFTPLNWNQIQTVTVTGVDDTLKDGNIMFKVITSAIISTDIHFQGVDPVDISVMNIDNDQPGITINAPAQPLHTTEAGGSLTFTVQLNAPPSANVNLALSSRQPKEGVLDKTGLIFTPANWGRAQTVTLTGVDDVIDDGDQAYAVVIAAAVSADAGYQGLKPNDLAVTNINDDFSQLIVMPTQGLLTTEAGVSDSFSLKLGSEPLGAVVVSLISSDLTEGTVLPSGITFTRANWNTPKIITLTGVSDAVVDGNIPYKIRVKTSSPPPSGDAKYHALAAINVSAVNQDIDISAGLTLSKTILNTDEFGMQDNFSVRLNTPPIASVNVAISGVDTTEGVLSTTSLTFTGNDWNTPKVVTVTGQDDFIEDGDISYDLTLTASSNDAATHALYQAVTAPLVSVTNVDNDLFGVNIKLLTGVVGQGLETSESGGQASFSVQLGSQPTADVNIVFMSSNFKEGTLALATGFGGILSFTPQNWNRPQTIIATGVDDNVQDGDIPYLITLNSGASSDPAYAALILPDINVVNRDNEIPTYTLSGTVINNASVQTGQIYLYADSLDANGAVSPTPLGTSVPSSGGAFSIRGVPAGRYTLHAWQDHLGLWQRTASNPAGVSLPIAVAANVSNISLNVNDVTVTAPVPPQGLVVQPMDSGALVTWQASKVSALEAREADNYTLYWSTTAHAGINNVLGRLSGITSTTAVVRGLNNGTAYYFSLTANRAGLISPAAPEVGPITPIVFATGFTLSGNLTLPNGVFTGNSGILVMASNQSSTQEIRAQSLVGSRNGVVAYSISGVFSGTWKVGYFIDNNDNGYPDWGDFSDLSHSQPLIINGDTSHAIAVTSPEATAQVSTAHTLDAGNASSYRLNFALQSGQQIPTRIAVSGTGLPTVLDIGNRGNLGGTGLNNAYELGGISPTIGNIYTFDIALLDPVLGGTRPLTPALTDAISAVLDLSNSASPTSPIGVNTLTQPLFKWTSPSIAPNGIDFIYRLAVYDVAGAVPVLIWEVKDIPSAQLSRRYNSTGTATQTALLRGNNYRWDIGIETLNHDSVTRQQRFTP